jgi:PAS domain S-box-containing protein
MLPSYKRFGIVLGFALLGLLLLGNALVTRHRVEVQAGTAQWVLHTQRVLTELEQAESTLKDAETGQRGYLLTGDAKYLAPYNRATTEIGPRIDDLARLTADSPAQQRNIAELRALAREKLDELGQTVALYRAGDAQQAKAIVLSDKGLLLMDRIDLLFAQMQQEETHVNGAQDAEYQRSIRMTELSIWLATLVALLGLVVLAFYISRQQALRDKYERKLRAGEELYRTTLTSIGDAVIATDRSGFVTFLNPVAEKLTGLSLHDASGKSIVEVFPIFNELTGNRVEDPVKKVMDLGVVVGLANHTVLKSHAGASIPIEDSAAQSGTIGMN